MAETMTTTTTETRHSFFHENFCDRRTHCATGARDANDSPRTTLYGITVLSGTTLFNNVRFRRPYFVSESFRVCYECAWKYFGVLVVGGEDAVRSQVLRLWTSVLPGVWDGALNRLARRNASVSMGIQSIDFCASIRISVIQLLL